MFIFFNLCKKIIFVIFFQCVSSDSLFGTNKIMDEDLYKAICPILLYQFLPFSSTACSGGSIDVHSHTHTHAQIPVEQTKNIYSGRIWKFNWTFFTVKATLFLVWSAFILEYYWDGSFRTVIDVCELNTESYFCDYILGRIVVLR